MSAPRSGCPTMHGFCFNRTINMTAARHQELYNLTAYDAGVKACEKGTALVYNPYPPGCDNHEAWAMGWMETDQYYDHLRDSEDPDNY